MYIIVWIQVHISTCVNKWCKHILIVVNSHDRKGLSTSSLLWQDSRKLSGDRQKYYGTMFFFVCRPSPNITHTVDGRSPPPADMVNIPLFTSFIHSRWWSPDFFHQQYGTILWPKSKKLQPAMFVSIVDQQLLLQETQGSATGRGYAKICNGNSRWKVISNNWKFRFASNGWKETQNIRQLVIQWWSLMIEKNKHLLQLNKINQTTPDSENE